MMAMLARCGILALLISSSLGFTFIGTPMTSHRVASSSQQLSMKKGQAAVEEGTDAPAKNVYKVPDRKDVFPLKTGSLAGWMKQVEEDTKVCVEVGQQLHLIGNYKTGEFSKSVVETQKGRKKMFAAQQSSQKSMELSKMKEAYEKANMDQPGTLTTDNMKLYCKAGPGGTSLGDCPFTHYVQMVLGFKDLKIEVVPTAPDAKPDWLVEDHEGKMPCLVHDDEAYTESSEIVDYLEYFFPDPPLTTADKELATQADEVTSKLFGALAKCIKNTNPSNDPPLVQAVLDELTKINSHLKLNKVDYLCGNELSLQDCSLAPKLYHAKTTLAHFKNTIIPPELSDLNRYMEVVFNSKAFRAGTYPPDVIIWGWNNARGTQAK